jgi:hypothetical protein
MYISYSISKCKYIYIYIYIYDIQYPNAYSLCAGTGKTHTLVGTQDDPGLIPRTLELLYA